MAANDDSRRAFLARIGVLGASAAFLPHCAWPNDGLGKKDAELLGLGSIINLLRPVLAELSRDTLNGLVAFTVPGQDRYSQAQGTLRSEPGGIEAGGTDFLIENLDKFLPFPDQIVRPTAAALVTALRDLPLELPPGGLLGILLGIVDPVLADVEDALSSILENDETVPLALPVALLLNYTATVVNPLSLNGLFLSPFARLSFAEKARALEMLETSQSNLVALLDANLPEPLKASVSGLLKFFGGALYEFSAFGGYGEAGVYDRRQRRITSRPVGWELSGYLPDNQTGDGWDDFLGYYQDRREVSRA